MAIRSQLTADDLRQCEEVADRMYRNAKKAKECFTPGGTPKKDYERRGVCGEFVFARWWANQRGTTTDVVWSKCAYHNRGMGDVDGMEVRTSKGYRMNYYPFAPSGRRRDDPSRIFVFVRQVNLTTFEIVGWLHGRDCIRIRWWHPEWKIYRVPQSELRPMEELPVPGRAIAWSEGVAHEIAEAPANRAIVA